MKNFIIFMMLSALFITLPANAQVNFGVIGGLNLANFSSDPEPEGRVDFKNRTSWQARL